MNVGIKIKGDFTHINVIKSVLFVTRKRTGKENDVEIFTFLLFRVESISLQRNEETLFIFSKKKWKTLAYFFSFFSLSLVHKLSILLSLSNNKKNVCEQDKNRRVDYLKKLCSYLIQKIWFFCCTSNFFCISLCILCYTYITCLNNIHTLIQQKGLSTGLCISVSCETFCLSFHTFVREKKLLCSYLVS